MHRRGVSCGGLMAGWIVIAAVLAMATPGSAQRVSINASSNPTVAQLRQAALGFLEKGQWASAKATVTQLLTADPQDALGLELRRLMVQQDRLDKTRQDQRQAAYDESVAKVTRLLAKQSWEESLGEATRAADLAPSKAELGRQPWFATLVDKSVKVAEGHRDKGAWLKATATYSQLASLFEKDNNEYRQLAKRTARYARLEAVYRDKAEVGKQLAGIDEAMMATVLEQVKRYYVIEPDYKKMALGGIDYLLVVTEAAALTKSLPVLEDAELKDKMRRELLNLRDQTAGREAMDLQQLAQVYMTAKRINLESVKLPEAMIIREFLDGAIEPLDNFSQMIWPADKSEFEKSMNGEFFGVGIQISLEDGQLTVVSPLEDTPAYRAGIMAGDVIIAIDGESTQGITLNQAVQRITGKAETPVVLTVRRASLPEPKDFRLIREKILIKTVKGHQRTKAGQWEYVVDADYGIGYVRVTNYMRHTVEDLEQAIDAMATQGARALVIDLRFNPGGLLNQAVEMSNLFLEDGVIVSTEGRKAPRVVEKARPGGTNLAWPIVVLVNEYSASAAEIVSGALKENNARAVIVGERTYGKGSVQNVIPVGGDRTGPGEPRDAPAYLKLTTAQYYLPSGQSLHRTDDSEVWGVEPNVTVKVTRDETADILDLRRESDVVHHPDEPPATQPATGPATQPARTRLDPQLETALMILRAELLRRKL